MSLKKKFSIFITGVSHVSFKRISRIILSPHMLLGYLSALFGYSIHQRRGHARGADASALMIFGDFDELHDRIAGTRGDFSRQVAAIKKQAQRNKDSAVTIGVSRYNFGRLGLIADFVASLLEVKIKSFPELKLFPVKDLPANFLRYIDEVKHSVPQDRIHFEFYDQELMEILSTVGLHAQVNPGRERDLLRLLGIICEQVFIGPRPSCLIRSTAAIPSASTAGCIRLQ